MQEFHLSQRYLIMKYNNRPLDVLAFRTQCGTLVSEKHTAASSRWQYVLPKFSCQATKLHGVIIHSLHRFEKPNYQLKPLTINSEGCVRHRVYYYSEANSELLTPRARRAAGWSCDPQPHCSFSTGIRRCKSCGSTSHTARVSTNCATAVPCASTVLH